MEEKHMHAWMGGKKWGKMATHAHLPFFSALSIVSRPQSSFPILNILLKGLVSIFPLEFVLY